MQSRSQLLSIVALARSGALDHAWRRFREAGLEAVTDDPAVLSLRGRLLRDQALARRGAAGQELLRQAAEAYGRAGAISGATYPLINAATLALLAGDSGQAARRARDVLTRLDRGEAEPDTPYYQAATRAEALLLLGETASAREGLATAVGLAPRAWEDHASTLQQFARILAARGERADWLDPLRPPRSLHFGGHMALDPRDAATAQAVNDVLRREGVGFGYGALAAGADIVIAEALLEHGAELHLTLPCRPQAFRPRSVAAMGGDWAARFDALLERADSVRWTGHPDDALSPRAVQLGTELAMGAAIQHARALASEAVQLLVLDPATPDEGAVGGSAWMASAWRAAGFRQHIVPTPRTREAPALPETPPTALAAVLEIVTGGDDVSLAEAARVAAMVLPALAAAIGAGPPTLIDPSWRGGSAQLVFATPAQAAEAALGLAAALRDAALFRIAGAYGLLPLDGDGRPLALGRTAAAPVAILRSTPPDAIHVTEAFALALLVSPDAGRPGLEYVGDLPGAEVEPPVRLFSLKAAATA